MKKETAGKIDRHVQTEIQMDRPTNIAINGWTYTQAYKQKI